MSRDLDARRLESAAIHRGRLRAAVRWGRPRGVRATGDDLERPAAGGIDRSFGTHRFAEPAGVAVPR